jgi:hypothetical protein
LALRQGRGRLDGSLFASTLAAIITQAIDVEPVVRSTGLDLEGDSFAFVHTDFCGETLDAQIAGIV